MLYLGRKVKQAGNGSAKPMQPQIYMKIFKSNMKFIDLIR